MKQGKAVHTHTQRQYTPAHKGSMYLHTTLHIIPAQDRTQSIVVVGVNQINKAPYID